MSIAFLTILPSLLNAGLTTAAAIKTMFATNVPGMTDAELDVVLGLVLTSATTQQKIAQSDLKPNVGP